MPRLQLAMPSSVWWRVLGWGSLTAGALLLASLLQAVATASIDSAVQAEPTTIDPSQGTTTPPSCESLVGQPLYPGQDTWVTQTHRQCANLSP
jgi:hypothetical protein